LREPGERRAFGLDDAEDLQRGHQPVAGRAVVAENQMPALLAAKIKPSRSISSITFLSPTAVRSILPPAF